MARVRSLNRAEKDIGVANGGHLNVILRTHGWHIDMDESVLWKAYASSPAHPQVRYVFCKPFTSGPWQIINYLSPGNGSPNIYQWKPDNEDWFFFMEYQDTSGAWHPAPGDPGHSDAQLTNNNNACNLYWNTPYNGILTLEAQ